MAIVVVVVVVAFLGIQHLLPEVADPSRSTALSYQEFPAQFFKPKSLSYVDQVNRNKIAKACSSTIVGWSDCGSSAVACKWVGWTLGQAGTHWAGEC